MGDLSMTAFLGIVMLFSLAEDSGLGYLFRRLNVHELFCQKPKYAASGLNIRCNSIHPAAIMTPMWDPMLGNGPDRTEREAAMVAHNDN